VLGLLLLFFFFLLPFLLMSAAALAVALASYLSWGDAGAGR
jgi:hypothetical protein